MWCPRHRFLVSSSSSTRRWPTTRKRCRSDTPSIAPQAGAVRSQSTAPLQHHHLHRAPLPRVCGVVILHRHGERAPMVNFGGRGPEAAAAQEEERRWLDRLPAAAELALLDSQFPVQSAAARTPRDRASRPFGCLTEKGLASMRELGRGIKKLHPGVLDVAGGAEGPGEPEAESRRRGKADAATAAPVQFDVFSSNFSRTQQSAQGLLHGLGAYQLAAGGQVPVRVRGERECTIHMYDNDPGTIQEEVAKVLNAPSFLARQAEQEALKRDLVRLIPGLTSEGFKWMEAADFFWCWPQDDLDMAPELKKLRQPTVEYVAWRFQQYYTHRPLLGLVIAPLVQEVLGTLQRMAAADAAQTALPTSPAPRCHVGIFSGHDVTVLAFLHALDWPLVHDPAWWPPYGCALVFELLEPSKKSGNGEYRVRIRLEMTGKSFPLALPVFACPASPAAATDDDAALPLSDVVRWLQQGAKLLA